jgi:hypothetical protein
MSDTVSGVAIDAKRSHGPVMPLSEFLRQMEDDSIATTVTVDALEAGAASMAVKGDIFSGATLPEQDEAQLLEVGQLANAEREERTTTNMDTTENQLTVEQWLAIRSEAGIRIDPETADVMCIHAQTLDPYGVYRDLPEEQRQLGREYFACSPGSDIWVWFGDLPDETREKLWEMRGYATLPCAEGGDPDKAETKKRRNECTDDYGNESAIREWIEHGHPRLTASRGNGTSGND